MKKNKYFYHYKDKIYWLLLTPEEYNSLGITNADEINDEQFELIKKYL